MTLKLARAIAYANRRAQDTKRRYFVTAEGHAAYDCRANRRAFEGLAIIYIADNPPAGPKPAVVIEHVIRCIR